MPITQAVNSKANIKKFTNNDVPFLPQFPVVSRTPVNQTTAGQTVFNLGFSVDTNNANSFLMSIDGKVLSIGASNDFTFTAINSLGFSSQVTLTSPVIAGLNWQALNLGVKKESEFNMDNRFVQLYAAMASGFQGYVDPTTPLIVATTSTGSPAAGTFYSSITGRSAIFDLSQDLKPRFGIERIMTQAITPLQNEFGPAGEVVSAVVNDDRNQIRFIGSGWQTLADAQGQYVGSATDGDAFEVTFYGTGLHLLHATRNVAQTYTVTVDGVANSTLTTGSTSHSTAIGARNYNSNVVYPVVNGLALSTHTVKFTRPAGTTATQYVFGFEIINANATPTNLSVNAGTGYVQGQKLLNSAQHLSAYNSGFTNIYGTAGARGGRVLVYQKSDGSIGKDIQYTNTATATLASADHTNEEPVHKYYFREFAASRTDDFSAAFGNNQTKAYTLDDGATTLCINGGNFYAPAAINNIKETLHLFTAGSSATFTFVGTGVDLSIVGSTSPFDQHTISIDGSNITTTAVGAVNGYTLKLASGLPYGTHTVKISRNVNVNNGLSFDGFTVYQPKTPVLPANTVELGAYNLMADFVANATAGGETIATGVLRKVGAREHLYFGTWIAPSSASNNSTGYILQSNTNGDYLQYTFFGTGFDFRTSNTGGGSPATWQFTLTDAANPGGVNNLSGFTNSSYGAAFTSWTPSTGTFVLNNTAQAGNGIRVSGMALGWHTVRCTRISGTGFISYESFDVITPIHSHKANTSFDYQNSINIGSMSIADGRKFTPVKDAFMQKKNITQSWGLTSSNPTSSSSTFVPIPDMSLTHVNTTGKIRISYALAITMGVLDNNAYLQVFVDGVAQMSEKFYHSAEAGGGGEVTDNYVLNVTPGFHKVEVYWRTSPGTATAYGRNLLVEDV